MATTHIVDWKKPRNQTTGRLPRTMNRTRRVSSVISQTRNRKMANAIASGGSWNSSSMGLGFLLRRRVHPLDVLAQHAPHTESRSERAYRLANPAEPFPRQLIGRSFQVVQRDDL